MSYGRDDQLCRMALTWLLCERGLDSVPKIDTQEPDAFNSLGGPWICVDFSPGQRFAILKTTGEVHRVEAEGAVEDSPVYVPDRATAERIAAESHR